MFVIERKGNISELANNLLTDRFWAELDRLESFRWPFIICEFNMSDVFEFPLTTNIPKQKWPELKMTPQLYIRKLLEIETRYKTRIIFAGAYGRETAISLFKRILECPLK